MVYLAAKLNKFSKIFNPIVRYLSVSVHFSFILCLCNMNLVHQTMVHSELHDCTSVKYWSFFSYAPLSVNTPRNSILMMARGFFLQQFPNEIQFNNRCKIKKINTWKPNSFQMKRKRENWTDLWLSNPWSSSVHFLVMFTFFFLSWPDRSTNSQEGKVKEIWDSKTKMIAGRQVSAAGW